MVKAVVIDFDDTLCLTEAACFELENEVLATLGRPPMSREIHMETWGKPLFEAIAVRSPGIDISAFEAAFHPLYQQYIKDEKLDVIPSENIAAIDALISTGRDIMVLTSRTHPEVAHLLESDHTLASRVSRFYHKDITHHHKPDPRVFDVLFNETGLAPQDCVYVGDSVSDAAASNAAGLKFIASLEGGLRSQDDFCDYSVDAFIDKFVDLPKSIDTITQAATIPAQT